jgi:hypothetical protein
MLGGMKKEKEKKKCNDKKGKSCAIEQELKQKRDKELKPFSGV